MYGERETGKGDGTAKNNTRNLLLKDEEGVKLV
jgi:hypothetical protein